MDKDLKALVAGDEAAPPAVAKLPVPDVLESDSEEAWNDFQDSQIAFDRDFEESNRGTL
jgi:hypothetical protein